MFNGVKVKDFEQTIECILGFEAVYPNIKPINTYSQSFYTLKDLEQVYPPGILHDILLEVNIVDLENIIE